MAHMRQTVQGHHILSTFILLSYTHDEYMTVKLSGEEILPIAQSFPRNETVPKQNPSKEDSYPPG